jgi:hypothetical protein
MPGLLQWMGPRAQLPRDQRIERDVTMQIFMWVSIGLVLAWLAASCFYEAFINRRVRKS